MRIASLISIASLCAAAGAFMSLYLGGDAVFDLQLWKMVLQGIWNAPGAMIEEAISGPEASFFRLVMTVVGGAAVAVASFVIGSLKVKTSNVLTERAQRSNVLKPGKQGDAAARASGREEVRKSRKDSRNVLSGVSAILTGALRRLRSALARKGNRKFRDSAIDLEQAQAQPKSRRVARAIAHIRRKVLDYKKARRSVVLAAGSEHESVIEVVEDLDFGEDLKAWQERAKRKENGEAAVIEEARLLSKRASAPLRKKIADEDGVSGEVRLQLLDAWAKRQPNQSNDIKKELLQHQGDDTAVYFEAIKAAAEMSAEQEDVVDESMWELGEDREFVDDLDAQVDDAVDPNPVVEEFVSETATEGQEEQSPDRDVANPDEYAGLNVEEDLSVELLADGVEDNVPDTTEEEQTNGLEQVSAESGGETGIRQIEEVISRITEFEVRATNVADFKEDWEPGEATSDERKKKIEDLFCELEERLGSGIERDQLNDRTRTWIDENLDGLEEEKRRLICLVSDLGESDGVDDGTDIESGFGLGGVSQIEGGAIPRSDSMDVDTNPVVESPEKLVAQVDEQDTIDRDIRVEGRDLGIPELDEIEMSDDIIFKWGYVVKTAGAADARIGHVLLVKNGLQRRVVGVIHLYARWRGKTPDDTKWLNVILRYIPEGDWHLEDGEGDAGAIKMMDNNGNFVQLSDEMAELLQGEGNQVVVHFHGPGADPKLFVERGNVIVTGSVLDAERITEKMS